MHSPFLLSETLLLISAVGAVICNWAVNFLLSLLGRLDDHLAFATRNSDWCVWIEKRFLKGFVRELEWKDGGDYKNMYILLVLSFKIGGCAVLGSWHLILKPWWMGDQITNKFYSSTHVHKQWWTSPAMPKRNLNYTCIHASIDLNTLLLVWILATSVLRT